MHRRSSAAEFPELAEGRKRQQKGKEEKGDDGWEKEGEEVRSEGLKRNTEKGGRKKEWVWGNARGKKGCERAERMEDKLETGREEFFDGIAGG